MLRLFASIFLVLLLVPGWTGETRLVLFDRAVAVHAERVRIKPGAIRFGRLTFVAAYRLTSASAAFAGFSALSVRGGRVLMLSDGGNWVSFTLAQGAASAVRAGALPAGPGTGWEKRDRDSESLAIDPATGRMWVGFEGANAIWRYAPGFAQAEGRVRPPAMRRWAPNTGAETLVRLRDGRFLTIAERGRKRRYPRPGLVFARDPVAGAPAPLRFAFRPPAGYDPSDAAELPDGDLLVLTRRFDWPFRFTAKLVVVPRRAIVAGTLVKGREIATLAGGVFAENWEGLAITRAGGRTFVWLVCDRDVPVLQHTTLAVFRLD